MGPNLIETTECHIIVRIYSAGQVVGRNRSQCHTSFHVVYYYLGSEEPAGEPRKQIVEPPPN